MKEEYKQFMIESNKIEGEDRLNPNDLEAVEIMLASDITEDSVLLAHSLLGKYLKKDWVGKYRECEVRVGNYFPPRAINVPYLMKEYFEKLPMMDSFKAHCKFEKIHPFVNLNGRIGRLIWLNKAISEGYKFQIPFLQKFYYQLLNNYEKL